MNEIIKLADPENPLWYKNLGLISYRNRASVAVLRWGQGAQAPQILPRPPKFLDTVVLLLVELIGSIVISLKFRLAVVASQMMRGQPPPNIFPRTAPAGPQHVFW